MAMNFLSLLSIEFTKIKRSMIAPLMVAVPMLVVISGVMSIRTYLTSEAEDAWGAMFIQSCLLYAYYLLPLSMIVVCTLLAGREAANHGISKMLTLPVRREAISLAKLSVLACFLLAEMAVYLIVFMIAGTAAAHTVGLKQTLPAWDLIQKCGGLFFTMVPCAAVMWLMTVLLDKPMRSAGVNLLLTIPGVLAANTPFWVADPYCYGGYFVTCAMADLQNGTTASSVRLLPFLPCAAGIFAAALMLSAKLFGKQEMR